jgi:glutamate dehydrogenase (NADP+)
MGGKVLTLSDSSGYIYDESGIDREKLDFVMDLKNVRRGRIKEYADKYPEAVYTALQAEPARGSDPLWDHKADCAFPSATQNEINETDAQNLVKNGVYVISEGANMPTTPDGVEIFLDSDVLYGPGKAANAGGVAVSGLEQSQNALRISWSRDEVDERLRGIMRRIHEQCVEAAGDCAGPLNYVDGANIAGFKKVADAMLAYGVV